MDRFKVVDLFRQEVFFQTSDEREAVGHAIGAAGTVVVDCAERRIYDGEYQFWSPTETYLGRFPSVAWLATL